MIPVLLLAAGKSSRMGSRDKLLEEIDGVPLLALLAERALQCGPTYVTLPSADHPRRAILSKAVTVIPVAGEMSNSIKTGIAALPAEAKGVLLMPADMPDITANDIGKVIAAVQESDALIVRACTANGTPGHPVYFDKILFPEFENLDGDRGAFHIAKALKDKTHLVPLEGNRARLDLDTPEDWDRYRNRFS
ncbi:nucleotidyltransferase family protein [Octadecabacter ascidiaceicola]|uniref:Purine catabolism protein PucB n=1 Tax=Octadecabacter ascidiaceicola TaxID=1655543 RepID=A0A238JKF0_9RHOB|nr:nucleotidyltransferase family protein [Octadecabacter ascidiaceicola]SMX31139.1 Purine catabolism protein PucB [Octadecabacter ascidiaceicola]